MKQVTSVNLIPLCILRILEKYSDAQSPVTQEELGELLAKEYGISCERKAIGCSLGRLREQLGVDIRYGSKGCWLGSRLFDDAELQLLADLALACRTIGEAQTRALIGKLASLSSLSFGYLLKKQETLRRSSGVPAPEKAENPEVSGSIREIRAAFSGNRLLRFRLRRGSRHLNALHIAAPRSLLLRNGSYCLLARDEMNGSEVVYPLEELHGVRALDVPA